MFISFRKQSADTITSRIFGSLGIDLNADCLAVTLITGDGNYKQSWTVPLHLRGKTSDQRNDNYRQCDKRMYRLG